MNKKSALEFYKTHWCDLEDCHHISQYQSTLMRKDLETHAKNQLRISRNRRNANRTQYTNLASRDGFLSYILRSTRRGTLHTNLSVRLYVCQCGCYGKYPSTDMVTKMIVGKHRMVYYKHAGMTKKDFEKLNNRDLGE